MPPNPHIPIILACFAIVCAPMIICLCLICLVGTLYLPVWWSRSLVIFAFGDITLVAWNQPQWENLYNRKQQMLKIWASSPPRPESWELSFTNISSPQVYFFWFLICQEIWAQVVASVSSTAQGCRGQRFGEFLAFPSGFQKASAALNIVSTFQARRRKEQSGRRPTPIYESKHFQEVWSRFFWESRRNGRDGLFHGARCLSLPNNTGFLLLRATEQTDFR